MPTNHLRYPPPWPYPHHPRHHRRDYQGGKQVSGAHGGSHYTGFIGPL